MFPTLNEATPNPSFKSVGADTHTIGTMSITSKKTYDKPPLSTPEVLKYMQEMEQKKDGRISPLELQEAFMLFHGKHFSDATCKFVVRIFDLDKNGGLDVKEFEELYKFIKNWVTAFNQFDSSRSGYLNQDELSSALKQLDVNFNPDFIRFLIDRNDMVKKRISLEQFLLICVQIQRFTDEYRSRDIHLKGKIELKYEEFLELVLRSL